MVSVQSNPKESLIRFEVVKTWDGEPETFYGVAQWDDFADVFTLTPTAQSKASHLSGAESYVMRFIGDHKKADLADIQGSTSAFTASTLKSAVVELVKRGYLENTNANAGGRGKRAEYTLTPQGEKVYDQIKNV